MKFAIANREAIWSFGTTPAEALANAEMYFVDMETHGYGRPTVDITAPSLKLDDQPRLYSVDPRIAQGYDGLMDIFGGTLVPATLDEKGNIIPVD